MRVRNKVIIIIVPVMLIAILLVNYIYGSFFAGYLETQEKNQIVTMENNIQSYLNEKLNGYLGQANDWGHWDDTRDFLNGNQGYVELNLTEDTFKNLDISFIMLLNSSGELYFSRYYDIAQNKFSEKNFEFINNILPIADAAMPVKDLSGIYKAGPDYYFIAATDITDSLMAESPNGKLIFGRIIDDTVLSAIENNTGSDIVTIGAASSENKGIPLGGYKISDDGKAVIVKFDAKNPDEYSEDVVFTIEKQRVLYTSGMSEFNKFVLGNIIFTLIAAMSLFTLMGIFMSKPFTRIINDVKNIDLKNIKKLQVQGKDEFAFLTGTINSMLEEIEQERSVIKENEEMLYATLLSVGDGVIVVDKEERITFMNPVAQKLTGWTLNEANSRLFDDIFNIINELTREPIASPIKEVFETEDVVELSNHTLLISKSGTERSIEDTAAPVRDKYGNVVGCVLVFRDFSEKKEKQKRIEYLSYHDQLTGLYNRRYFEDELRRLDTGKNLPISLIYADVNGLKTINDAFGHSSGDKLIQQTAEVLKDICSDSYIISRTGGDEFIMLLAKTNTTDAEDLVERIKKSLEKQNVMGIGISLSFGWDTKTSPDQSIWDMLKNAEDIMYQKKILASNSKRSAVIESILAALHVMCPPEEAHSKRVGHICEAIGRAYGMRDDELKELKMAGELHDIGKIAMDKSVLYKKEPLSESEWLQIKAHPETGYRILSTSREYYHIAEYVLAHHERWDGKGYPKGLAGEDTNLRARIIAVADAYDAMTSERPYRSPMSRGEAVKELIKNSGKQFDPGVVKAFITQILETQP